MPIKATFRLIEKRKIIDKDPQPVYVFEAIGDTSEDGFSDGEPLGKIKLRVNKKKAQEELVLGDRYTVEITKRKR